MMIGTRFRPALGLSISLLLAAAAAAQEPSPPPFEPVEPPPSWTAPESLAPGSDLVTHDVGLAAEQPGAGPGLLSAYLGSDGAAAPPAPAGADAEPGPPVEALPTGRCYAFGRSVPTLVCVPGRACDLELEAGEKVDGLVVGDPDRWATSFLSEGAGDLVPHVLLEPAVFDLRTNLVVVTDRRTYHLELRSPRESEVRGKDGEAAYDVHISFSYPEAWVRRVRSDAERKAAPGAPTTVPDAALDPSRLDFGFELRTPRARKRRLPWAPVTVFSDGTRTFLRLPEAARAGDLPVLLGLLADGKTYPLNARLEGDWYVVPAVFAEAELVSGTGKARRSLRIVHRDGKGGR